jgi:hypothetical protein
LQTLPSISARATTSLNNSGNINANSTFQEINCHLTGNGENIMLLENKNAVIYGAGGSVGGAVARHSLAKAHTSF